MQAVIQLAANAVKFSAADDAIAIGASWGELDDGGRRLQLWVRDTGAGIDVKDQARIFERFGRASAGRTVEGSGLGLAIVEAIARGHGGRIALRSELGVGSQFTLVLPEGGASAQPGEALS